MDNNTAFVAKLSNIQPIEGADKIVSAAVTLNGAEVTRVIVGVETQENTPIVYFDSNMCIAQDIIDSIDKLNPKYKDANFVSIGNYLAKSNRVRCIKLRGVYSNGLTVSVDIFKKIFPSVDFSEGFSFTDLDSRKVCYKYTAPIKIQSQSTGKKARKGKPVEVPPERFPEHIDTQQYLKNINSVHPEDIIHVSSKWHGTSARTGNVFIPKKLNFIEKIVSKFIPIKTGEYKYVHGSRRVIKFIEDTSLSNKNHYYKYDLWTDAGEKYFKGKLVKGETVYYEIVGWLPTGEPIQKMNKYVYNYGVDINNYKIVVYRITMTSEDGYTLEYNTQQVKERCKELGVDPVIELYYGKAKNLFDIEVNNDWVFNFSESLKRTYLEKNVENCILFDTPDEGVVIRKETFKCEVYKLKSMRFLNLESKSYDEDKTEDIEDSN